jgi:hypothetical protein
MFVIDSARAQNFSCYGYPRPTTPRIDRLLEQVDGPATQDKGAPLDPLGGLGLFGLIGYFRGFRLRIEVSKPNLFGRASGEMAGIGDLVGKTHGENLQLSPVVVT